VLAVLAVPAVLDAPSPVEWADRVEHPSRLVVATGAKRSRDPLNDPASLGRLVIRVVAVRTWIELRFRDQFHTRPLPSAF
jgi:hypothetical protein